MKIKIKPVLFSYLVIVVVGFLSWIAGISLVQEIRQASNKQEIFITEQKLTLEEQKVSRFPDFDAIKGENPDPDMKVLIITEECPNNGCVNEHSATVDFNGIRKTFKASGQFSRAYLYAELLVDYERPLTSWDDFYFKIGNQGGHLLVDDNVLPTPSGQSSTYLYNLGSISYYPSIANKEMKTNVRNNINFFFFLEHESTMTIHTSLSSNRPGRVMREVSIYYECLEDSNCSISRIGK